MYNVYNIVVNAATVVATVVGKEIALSKLGLAIAVVAAVVATSVAVEDEI